MKSAGFAGGLFAIFVPPLGAGKPPDFKAAMANPPYHMPQPPQMTHAEAQPDALAMAGLLHWMERSAPYDFKVCRSASDMVSEMELAHIKERQRAGIEAAKKKGVYKGRPPTAIDTDKLLQLGSEGVGATAIAKELGCTRYAVYKALERIN